MPFEFMSDVASSCVALLIHRSSSILQRSISLSGKQKNQSTARRREVPPVIHQAGRRDRKKKTPVSPVPDQYRICPPPHFNSSSAMCSGHIHEALAMLLILLTCRKQTAFLAASINSAQALWGRLSAQHLQGRP